MFITYFFFLFFFKQKTAYEMRISDWSSDVCSSDLHVLAGLHADGPVRGKPAGVQHYVEVELPDGRIVAPDGVFPHRRHRLVPVEQIGRASCRERVCQYV